METIMKKITRLISLLIIIAIFVSAFCVNTSAAVSKPTISNMGTRDQLATQLSEMAISYYTAGYTYDDISAKSDSEALSALRSFMTTTHKNNSSYDNCKEYAYYTDCQNGNGKATLIYSSYEATSNQWAGSNGNGWNREHVWPQSLGGFKTSGAGSDLHHVRPSDAKINSTRNNCKYGNVNGGTQATGVIATNSGGERLDEVFEPLDNVKGDVARICLYVYVRYGSEISQCSKITNVFESVEVLLEWCELDPVDTWELSRNDVVESVQGNRNVFIDYPEYAWMIFDKDVPTDMATPSGEAKLSAPAQNGGNNETDANGNTDATQATDATQNNDVSKPTSKPSNGNSSNNSNKDNNSESGCGSTITVSAICVVGIVGIAAVVKKKED
jgi:endonuclease I